MNTKKVTKGLLSFVLVMAIFVSAFALNGVEAKAELKDVKVQTKTYSGTKFTISTGTIKYNGSYYKVKAINCKPDAKYSGLYINKKLASKTHSASIQAGKLNALKSVASFAGGLTPLSNVFSAYDLIKSCIGGFKSTTDISNSEFVTFSNINQSAQFVYVRLYSGVAAIGWQWHLIGYNNVVEQDTTTTFNVYNKSLKKYQTDTVKKNMKYGNYKTNGKYTLPSFSDSMLTKSVGDYLRNNCNATFTNINKITTYCDGKSIGTSNVSVSPNGLGLPSSYINN